MRSVDLAQLVAAAGDAIIVSDEAGRITLWNPAAQRIFGFTPEEALGQSMDIIIPERLRQRHWDGYRETMRTGATRYGADVLRVPAVDKAGRALSIAFTVCLFAGAGGKPAAIAAIIRDETARFAQERELRKQMAALEAEVAALLAARGTVP